MKVSLPVFLFCILVFACKPASKQVSVTKNRMEIDSRAVAYPYTTVYKAVVNTTVDSTESRQ